MTRLALALALAAGTASAAPIQWVTDPVTGLRIGLTGERVAPTVATPLTKGGPIPEEPERLGFRLFTCPPWRGVEWVMLTETICASPLGRDPLGVAWRYERPRLWTSCDCTETRTGDPHEPPRTVRPEPETPARVPLPATWVMLAVGMLMLWRMR